MFYNVDTRLASEQVVSCSLSSVSVFVPTSKSLSSVSGAGSLAGAISIGRLRLVVILQSLGPML
jgi:hypothetical protein